MKGIILAGGNGTRLYPASIGISKSLLPIYDKPMLYYPLATLMQAGIRDILIITNHNDLEIFKKLLGNGSNFGINLSYAEQSVARGIADALLIGKDFINGEPCALILGDNIFHGTGIPQLIRNATQNINGATVFAYEVRDPERFGVVEFDKNQRAISLEEKPKQAKSNYAVTGLYFYDGHACEYARSLHPSSRGELEITDLNKIYLNQSKLTVEILGSDTTWLDAGTPDSMLQASNIVKSVESRTGQKIACLEEIAYKQGFISAKYLFNYLQPFKGIQYYDYVREIILKDIAY